MIVRKVSAMRFNELRAKGNHSDKYCEYKWLRNKNGELYCIATQRGGEKFEIKRRT